MPQFLIQLVPPFSSTESLVYNKYDKSVFNYLKIGLRKIVTNTFFWKYQITAKTDPNKQTKNFKKRF